MDNITLDLASIDLSSLSELHTFEEKGSVNYILPLTIHQNIIAVGSGNMQGGNITLYQYINNTFEKKKTTFKIMDEDLNSITELPNGNIIISGDKYIFKILSIMEDYSVTIIQEVKIKDKSSTIYQTLILEDGRIVSCSDTSIDFFNVNPDNKYSLIKSIEIDKPCYQMFMATIQYLMACLPNMNQINFYDVNSYELIQVLNDLESCRYTQEIVRICEEKNIICVGSVDTLHFFKGIEHMYTCFIKKNLGCFCLIPGTNSILGGCIYNYDAKKFTQSIVKYDFNGEDIKLDNKEKVNVCHDQIWSIRIMKEGFVLIGSHDRTFRIFKIF